MGIGLSFVKLTLRAGPSGSASNLWALRSPTDRQNPSSSNCPHATMEARPEKSKRGLQEHSQRFRAHWLHFTSMQLCSR